MERINLREKLDRFEEHWSPKVIGQFNDNLVKLVKVEGEFVWHQHEHEDELFIVLSGRLTMQFRDGEVEVGPGEIIIVPHGVEHCPLAHGLVEIMLIEPTTVVNTGNAGGDRTVATEEWI